MNAARYLQNASDCLDIASRVAAPDQEKLVRLASAWRKLAEQELVRKPSQASQPANGASTDL